MAVSSVLPLAHEMAMSEASVAVLEYAMPMKGIGIMRLPIPEKPAWEVPWWAAASLLSLFAWAMHESIGPLYGLQRLEMTSRLSVPLAVIGLAVTRYSLRNEDIISYTLVHSIGAALATVGAIYALGASIWFMSKQDRVLHLVISGGMSGLVTGAYWWIAAAWWRTAGRRARVTALVVTSSMLSLSWAEFLA